MDDFIKGILRRFNILGEIIKNNGYDENDQVHSEYKNLSTIEIGYFSKLINKYLEKYDQYTSDSIRQQLITLGYTNSFINYLMGINEVENKIIESDEDFSDLLNSSNEDSNSILINNMLNQTNDNFTVSFEKSKNTSNKKNDMLMQLSDNSDYTDSDKNSDSDNNNSDKNCDSDNNNDNDTDSSVNHHEEINNKNQTERFNELFQMRPNQKKAIDETIKQDFKSGIHNQIMGAGKSYILLRTIAEHFEIYQENKVYLLLCDRQEILKKMFFDDDYQIDHNKIIKWRASGIIDLTKYNIVEYVHHKKKDLIKIINYGKKKKPILMICNNAFLRANDYSLIRTKKIALVLVDECHSVSATTFYTILRHFKYQLKIPIIGFSATPLRLRAEKNLCSIFSADIDAKNKYPKLNIISQYGLFDAIQDDIVLPLNYHFIEVKPKDKKQQIPAINYDITKNIINKILPELPYKKIICWCRSIIMLKKWYHFFKKEYPKLQIFMSSFRDKTMSQQGYNCDYDAFYKLKSNGILICVNRCREGSDIPNLDCGIYLDAVKNRSILVAMQTSGRVIRPDDARLKRFGVMIDMFITPNGKCVEHLTIDKIFNYYDQILNLAEGIDELKDTQTKQFKTYMKYKDLLRKTFYDEDKNEITIGIDSKKKIKIHVELIDKQINWELIKELLELEAKTKCQINDHLELIMNFKIIAKKIDVKKLNPFDWDEWYKKLCKKYEILIPAKKIKSDKYSTFWNKKNWFDGLKIKKIFYQTIDDLVNNIPNNVTINNFDDYLRAAKKDQHMPLDVVEYYDITENQFINKIKLLRQSNKKKTTKKLIFV